MLSKNIKFKNFTKKKINKNLKILFKKLTDKNSYNDKVIRSFSKTYSYSFTKKQVKKFKKFNFFQIYGMGGSSLGIQAIYDFMKSKIKKKFYFFDNLDAKNKIIKTKNKSLNLIISKSGNTLETIVNENIFSGSNKLYITENSNNYLRNNALRLKKEIIEHKNFIGGRYSVLSEVGMLPAELMGLNSNNFKNLNMLVKNKKFLNNLILNVSSTHHFIKNKKFNSIIINYDEKSQNLFNWYQQLIAESLGKKKKGLLPIVSNMPKDNHSVMQLYLDGFKNNFYTFFYVHENKSIKINNKLILKSQSYLKNKDLAKITLAQKKATENVFQRKNIPFRSFVIKKRDEKTLGELFSFFVLETILLSKLLNVNPYNQPEVELIKKETKNLLLSK